MAGSIRSQDSEYPRDPFLGVDLASFFRRNVNMSWLEKANFRCFGRVIEKPNLPPTLPMPITVENRDYHHLSQTEIAGGRGFLGTYPAQTVPTHAQNLVSGYATNRADEDHRVLNVQTRLILLIESGPSTMTPIDTALVVMGVPIFCFVSAAAIESRRDPASLKHLVRILPLAIAVIVSILFLSFLSDSPDFPSNRFCNAMSLAGLLVAACGFLCRYRSRFAAALIVVGGLLLAYFWLISRMKP